MAKEAGVARATVEVRLKSKTMRQFLPDGTETVRRQGDVFHIDRAVYEADIEPDRGMGVPAHGRTFQLLSEEKEAEQQKAAEQQSTQDRIRGVRESVRDQMQSLENARITAKAQEAENLKAAADALKPLERAGARRVG
jgi:hypothetical protein